MIMSTLFWKTVKASPVLLFACLFVASGASAAESNPHQMAEGLSIATIDLDAEPTASSSPRFQLADSTFPEPVPGAGTPSVESNQEILQQIQRYGNQGSTSLDQVTSVGQLRDVSPGDWAYEALRSLVERYGCIAGYPDGTYRGNRALTRYEFAAGLNACLQQIERLLVNGDGPNGPDLTTLRRLIQEFEAELATLGARVDNLEGRVAFLEDNQFSTTTKLKGEVIFALADTFGDSTEDFGSDDETNLIFADRVRLNLETSFTGRDRLRTRLQARNISSFSGDLTGTNMTRLGFDGDNGNDVEIDELWYRFPLGEKISVQIDATGVEYQDTVIDPINPYFASSGSGAISRFGRFNPIYRAETGGPGITATFNVSDALSLSAGYVVDGGGSDPADENGLFDGNYAALGQVAFTPTENISLAATYLHSYYNGGEVNVTGSTGSSFASAPFGNNDTATSVDAYGIQANALFGKFSVGGWVGYQDAEAESGANEGADADIWNWAVNLALLDIGGEGNKLGFIFGMPPKTTGNDIATREDDNTSYHLEAFYRYQLTDNIAITPGAFVIFNPEHDDDNDTQFVGTLRTVFSF
ncbi:iron uptake porin [Coleofasciculus chthonoplastes]|uniref:iron uptake porin n=1 Tax=Coleofasciculus chthonoplastes TaxID=64178 RepID=UPI0032F3843C